MVWIIVYEHKAEARAPSTNTSHVAKSRWPGRCPRRHADTEHGRKSWCPGGCPRQLFVTGTLSWCRGRYPRRRSL